MKLLARLILVTACFTAAFTAGTIAHASSASAATWYQEGAACIAAWEYRTTDTTPALYADEALWQHDWHHAWHEANGADPALRGAIHRYLFTDRGWGTVAYDCGYAVN
jgi:hypothetical protein